MKLTDEDKKYLKELGYHKKDLKQIAVATSLRLIHIKAI
jgi:hypothetical protein